MLASLCLRRSKQAIALPSRKDTTHKVGFDAEEAAHYNSSNARVTGFLDQQARQSDLRSYSNILTKINSLRQICNLGTYYQAKIGVPESQNTAMQELFEGMISAGTAMCCKCERDVSEADEGNFGFDSCKPRVATCGELICASCFAISEMEICPSDGRCQYQNSCKLFAVNSSSSPNLSAIQPNSRLPTKMRALQQDLLALPVTDKRYLVQPPEELFILTSSISIIFSFWTTTLDLAGVALDQVNFPYTRVDGTIPAKQRQLALESFVKDPRIRTILISLRCGSNGYVEHS